MDKKQIHRLVMKMFATSIFITEETKYDCFFEYSAHVHSITVRVHKKNEKEWSPQYQRVINLNTTYQEIWKGAKTIGELEDKLPVDAINETLRDLRKFIDAGLNDILKDAEDCLPIKK